MLLAVGLGIVVVAGAACTPSGGASQREEAEPACLYEPKPLADPDAVPAGFDSSPRRIFAPALVALSGATQRAAFELQLTPRYEELVALYDSKKQNAQCTPLLRVPVNATLALGAAPSAHVSGTGRLELRATKLLAGIALSPPARLAPSVAEPVQKAELLLNLSGLGTPAAASEWRWTVTVDCAGKPGCTSQRDLDSGNFALKSAR